MGVWPMCEKNESILWPVCQSKEKCRLCCGADVGQAGERERSSILGSAVWLPRGESASSENFQVSPEFLRAAEWVARDDPKHRRGALSDGNHHRTLKTLTKRGASDTCQSREPEGCLWEYLFKYILYPLTLLSFFLYFTQKWFKMVSNPGRVGI